MSSLDLLPPLKRALAWIAIALLLLPIALRSAWRTARRTARAGRITLKFDRTHWPAVDEISIKLGLKVGDLKAALADAGASIKKFKKDAESTGDDGILGTIKKSTKALQDFRQLFLGGAIAAAVKGFYAMAVESAEKNTDATNENARAVRDFAKAITEAKSFAGDFAVTVIGTFNRLGEAIGDTINIARSFIQNGTQGFEVWARNADLVKATAEAALAQERQLADVRKKHGAEFQSITKELASIEEKTQALRLKGLNVYETEGNLLAKVSELKRKLAEFDGTAIEKRRLILELAKTQLSAEEAGLAVKKDLVEAEKRMAEEAKKATEEKRKQAEEEKKAYDELSKRRALALEDEVELTILQNKRTDQLTRAERDRIKLLEQAKTLRIIEVEIEDLMEQKITDGLIPAEVARLTELEKQRQKLAAQLGLKGQLATTTTTVVVPAEVKVVELLTEEVRLAKMLNDEKNRQAAIEASRKGGTIKTTGDIRGLSDIQLDQVIRNINQQLGPIRAQDASYHGPGQPLGTYKSVEQYMLQNQLDQAMAEAKLRRDFATTLQTFGAAQAERSFAPADFARLENLFNPDLAKQQTTSLNNIDKTLRNLFPEAYGGVR